jgi:hypothetical protein
MKPLNFDNSPCSPTSSNCVIWGGPDLPCINLCKGDSITDVIEKLATELCGILDVLNISAYDITCFNLANCAPQTFTDLINFLIVKVCELENIPPSGGGTTPSTGCPTDCFVEVAPCFVVGTATTMNLTNYVNVIGIRICELANTIALQQIAINSLDNRVTVLESAGPPVIPVLSMVMAEELPSVPSLPAGSTQLIQTVVDSFVNQIWFPFVATTGDSGLLANSISQQTVASTDLSKVNPAAQMSAQYAGLWTTPTGTIAGTINNIWACIEDLRNAPLQSPFYLYGTTTDAGNNKTTAIQRSNSIHTIGADSYFNSVRVGLGNSNIISNTAIGSGVLATNTTGNFNVGVGYLALNSNTSGVYNTAVGARALIANTTGNYNVAIGENALQSNQSATHNTAIGVNALSALVTGFANTAIGYQALLANTGTDNTAIGYGTLQKNTTGIYNSAIGKTALGENTTGTSNVALGYNAGSYGPLSLANANSTNCVYIGTDASSLTSSDTNQIVIGFNAAGQGSNTIQLGNTSIVRTYLQGDLTVSNATAVTTASVSQTKHFPIVINGVTYKLLLAD